MVIISGVGVAVVCGALIVLGGFLLRGYNGYIPHRMPIYFFNPSEGRLIPELRQLPEGDEFAQISVALGYLLGNPSGTSLAPTNLAGGELVHSFRKYRFEESGDTILALNLSELYYEMDLLEAALFRAALMLTMSRFVDFVQIITPYDEWIEPTSQIANNPNISPIRYTSRRFTLFFVDESWEGLISEERIVPNVNTRRPGATMLELLIRGPETPGAIRSIPPAARILRVIPGPEGFLVYIDLSNEFVTRFSGNQTQARLMIASIVNTLTYPGNIDFMNYQVRFFIDNQRREDFHGITNFHSAFLFDTDKILGIEEYIDQLEDDYIG